MEPILEEIKVDGYHKVIKVTEPKSGLLGIIAIHDMTLGPAVGGIRFRNYSSFDEALEDVLRLSKGMTYKFAVSPNSYGGGKSVIITDPKTGKNVNLLRAFGKAIEMLEGDYIGAEDSGCTTKDLDIINKETSYLIGLQNEKGSGNPAPFTAWGTFRGIEASLFKSFGSISLEGKIVAIQGIGMVGEVLAEHLFWRGAHLIIADINAEVCKKVAKKFSATICDPQEILKVHCDVLAPCAFGGIINKETIPSLNCKILAGCANNQLLQDSDADILKEKGILYAPDFVINGGGAMSCVNELEPEGHSSMQSRKMVDHIFENLLEIFDISEKKNISTLQASKFIAKNRLRQMIEKNKNLLFPPPITKVNA